MRAHEFDDRFDRNEDVTAELKPGSAIRPALALPNWENSVGGSALDETPETAAGFRPAIGDMVHTTG